METEAEDNPETGAEADAAIDEEAEARPVPVGLRPVVFIRRPQKTLVTALLASILGFGVALRLQFVSAYNDPTTSKSGDTQRFLR